MGLYFLSLFLLSHLPECACYSLVIIYPFSFYRFTLIRTRKLCILSRNPLYYHENSQQVSVIIQAVSVFV